MLRCPLLVQSLPCPAVPSRLASTVVPLSPLRSPPMSVPNPAPNRCCRTGRQPSNRRRPAWEASDPARTSAHRRISFPRLGSPAIQRQRAPSRLLPGTLPPQTRATPKRSRSGCTRHEAGRVLVSHFPRLMVPSNEPDPDDVPIAKVSSPGGVLPLSYSSNGWRAAGGSATTLIGGDHHRDIGAGL